MTFSSPIEYSTDGAPLLIGSVEHAQHWSGSRDNGTGITVEYGGIGVETLPLEYAQTRKAGGKRVKRFATAEEATRFEQALLTLFLKLHPGAKRPSRYPDYSGWFVGTETEDGVYPTEDGVFGIERKFASDYRTMTKKLAGDVGVIAFHKKTKASALFLDMEGGGSGEVAMAATADLFVVARVITSNGDPGRLIASLGKPARRRSLGELELSGHVVVFHAAKAAAEIAQHSWHTTSLVDGFHQASRAAASGPLLVADQRRAGGAFFRVKPGTYRYAVERNRKAGPTVFDVLWVWTG